MVMAARESNGSSDSRPASAWGVAFRLRVRQRAGAVGGDVAVPKETGLVWFVPSTVGSPASSFVHGFLESTSSPPLCVEGVVAISSLLSSTLIVGSPLRDGMVSLAVVVAAPSFTSRLCRDVSAASAAAGTVAPPP